MAEKSLYGGSIERIRNAVKQVAGYRHASPARYEVAFAFERPNNMLMPLTQLPVQQRLSDSLESVQLPGRGHSSQANTIYGPTREMPYQSLYSGDIDMTFRIGSDYLEREFFEVWNNTMVGLDNNYEYYDNYIANLQIRALGREDDLLYEVTARECYPKNMGAIDYGFEKVDDLTRVTISLAFRKYDVTYYTPLRTQSTIPSTPSLPPNIGGPGGAPSYGGPNAPGGDGTAFA
tara:strand:- start:6856 stop:7554 length:699 start_codon:yes stop_codon:yes gene_type:complete